VNYSRPVPIDQPVNLRAAVAEVSPKKSVLHCELRSGDQICATAQLVAVRVAPEWLAAT